MPHNITPATPSSSSARACLETTPQGFVVRFDRDWVSVGGGDQQPAATWFRCLDDFRDSGVAPGGLRARLGPSRLEIETVTLPLFEEANVPREIVTILTRHFPGLTFVESLDSSPRKSSSTQAGAREWAP